MYHYLNTKCGLFFIALAPSYLCSIHISFSFYCAGSLLFPSHSFCSVFLYAFIISQCPCISQSLFIWVKKSYFQSFYFLVLHNSQFPLLVSFFPPSITWFSPFHIFATWSSSLFQNSWFSVLPPTTYIASSSNNWFFCLLPMECVGFFPKMVKFWNSVLSKFQM